MKEVTNHVPSYSKGCPIDPRHPFLVGWTVMMVFCIIFEVTVTPFGIGFLPVDTECVIYFFPHEVGFPSSLSLSLSVTFC